QAVAPALGGRPDADLVRTGAEEAAVEALFANVPAPVRERLAGAGIPAEAGQEELLVRRLIGRGSRARAYVNGALAPLALLRDLAPHLLRVYGQDEHQALRRVESHRELLDAVGSLGRTLEEMRARHGRLVAAREAIARARADAEAAGERAEMLRAQVEELAHAALVAGEEESLSAERARLVHAERLAVLATGAEEGLYSGEGAVIDVLGRALVALREAAGLDPGLASTRALLESALAEVEEAGEPRPLRPRARPRRESPGRDGGAPGAARAPEAQVRRHGRGSDPTARGADRRAERHRERRRDQGGARGRGRGGPARRCRMGGPALGRAPAGGPGSLSRPGRGARGAGVHRGAPRGPFRRDRGPRARPRGLGRGRVLTLDAPGRGAALARPRGPGRRAVAHHARPE